MKKIIYIFLIAAGVLTSSCSDWLDVLPKNEQVTDKFWKSKEDVEAVLASGYFYMRKATPLIIDWGELRGASVITPVIDKRSKLQSFQMEANSDFCKWDVFYQTINMANSVIAYAPSVMTEDDTYLGPLMNSHLSEAYFMRALMYFYLVRNFREVPLALRPYVDDSAPYELAKSSESEIIAQIKKDIQDALATGAAKEAFDGEPWVTKGRATKWALYALMADVCLWSEDYDNCIIYANLLLEADATFRPVFITESARWFEIFNPGNSNESIFELNWDYATYNQTSNSPSNYFTVPATTTTIPQYRYSMPMLARLKQETIDVVSTKDPVRSLWGAYICEVDDYMTGTLGYVFKYMGEGLADRNAVRTQKDANYIIYRMADVMLMKAESLVMKGEASWPDAVAILNKIRLRANLPDLEIDFTEVDELKMIEYVLNERDMELAAEGKRWYDLVRFGKCKDYKYKNEFIDAIVLNNNVTNSSWIKSVLKNDWAWYLPVHDDELQSNKLLKQNPYYSNSSK